MKLKTKNILKGIGMATGVLLMAAIAGFLGAILISILIHQIGNDVVDQLHKDGYEIVRIKK